jgi:hypothetical protein
MTFIEKFERDMAGFLELDDSDSEAIIRWASERILQSYKNGIEAGRKGATVIRKGQSRGRRIPS